MLREFTVTVHVKAFDELHAIKSVVFEPVIHGKGPRDQAVASELISKMCHLTKKEE